jgi:hypothetical protein
VALPQSQRDLPFAAGALGISLRRPQKTATFPLRFGKDSATLYTHVDSGVYRLAAISIGLNVST